MPALIGKRSKLDSGAEHLKLLERDSARISSGENALPYQVELNAQLKLVGAQP